MDLLTDRINSFMRVEQPVKQVVNEHKNTVENDSPNQTLKPDVVNISAEGEQKLADDKDKRSLWQDLHKLSTSQQELFEAEESTAEQGAIDAAIKRLEKQIRELQERMEPLKGKEDEASKEQLKHMEAELFALNTQLMEFHNKKLEELKRR